METYLSDTAKKNVMNRPAILRRFVESHQAFMERKVQVAQIFSVQDQIRGWANTALNEITFHNVEKAMKIYESVFAVQFPREHLPELSRAVQRRHDIIHRNGKDISGHLIDVRTGDLEHLIGLVTRTISFIDKQIKDGLIEHN